MIIPREADFTTKQKNSTSGCNNAKRTSSSRSKLDPRIVSVSRAFGGKDRHSKVCTVRGLRDRRVRLSVPTAIQLYDLQDRLGLDQPSKVVDWLLNAAKHEIDELPPLQGSLFISQRPQEMLTKPHEFTASQLDKQGDHFNFGGKSKDVSAGETSTRGDENWGRSQEERQNPTCLSSLLSGTTAYNSLFGRWDASNLTLSHPPRSLESTCQQEDFHSFSLVQLPSTLSSPSGSHQVLVYQPATSRQPYVPSQIATMSTAFDPKQVNFQSSGLSNSCLISSVHESTTTQLPVIRPFQFSVTADLLHSQKNAANEENKRNDFHLS